MLQRFKYNRTFNLPWSQSDSSDDVWWKDCADFEGKEVVVTEKLDGEVTNCYPDGHVHARSIDTDKHPSRSWMRAFAGTWCYKIPTGWRICGENVYACHSIFYANLPTYFFAFGVYDENNVCVSWDDTVALCKELGIETVPVIYRGVWEYAKSICSLWSGKGTFPTFESETMDQPTEAEGYVVRLAEAFPYDDFRNSCAKYVRKSHVKTNNHWMNKAVTPNKLKVIDATHD